MSFAATKRASSRTEREARRCGTQFSLFFGGFTWKNVIGSILLRTNLMGRFISALPTAWPEEFMSIERVYIKGFQKIMDLRLWFGSRSLNRQMKPFPMRKELRNGGGIGRSNLLRKLIRSGAIYMKICRNKCVNVVGHYPARGVKREDAGFSFISIGVKNKTGSRINFLSTPLEPKRKLSGMTPVGCWRAA